MTRKRLHKLGCDECHAHHAPECCAPECWCKNPPVTFSDVARIAKRGAQQNSLVEAREAVLKAVRQAREALVVEVRLRDWAAWQSFRNLLEADEALERREKEPQRKELHIRPKFHADGDIDEEAQCPKTE